MIGGISAEELSEFSGPRHRQRRRVTPVSEIGEYRSTPGNISLSLADDYSKMVRRELVQR